ncbi:MAG: fibronectin type III domain-containing protein [Bacteroides sp.]
MKTKTLYLYLLTLACLLPFGGCSGDDEIQTTPLASPSVAADQATVSTLQFSWQAVPGAVQYAYQLHDAAGNLVQGDVTNTTSATFTQLTDNTTYTLTVWAYAAYGSEQSRSATVTLTATTLPILQLQAPQAQVQVDGGSVSVSWPAVADAGYYSYRVMDAEGGVLSQADTYDTSCSFSLHRHVHLLRSCPLRNRRSQRLAGVGCCLHSRAYGALSDAGNLPVWSLHVGCRRHLLFGR